MEKRLAGLADGEEAEVNAVFDEDQALRDKYSPNVVLKMCILRVGCVLW